MSINKAIIIGRLGQNPELKRTPSGVAVCSITVATSESWKDKTSGEKKEKVEWHRVTLWNKNAENCAQYLKKGSQVYIEGKLETRCYDDKEGRKCYTTEIKADTVQFLSTYTNTSENDLDAKEVAKNLNGIDPFADLRGSENFKEIKDTDELPF